MLLFEIPNSLNRVEINFHDTLDTKSVISIFESTFKNRLNESQGGLIKEKILELILCDCPNVNHEAIDTYLTDNQDNYDVKYNYHTN